MGMSPEEAAHELELSGMERPEEIGAANVGEQLAYMRANFTAENVRKAAKAKSTFNKHQNNQTRFILWLSEKVPDYFNDELLRDLAQIHATINYTERERQYDRYTETHRPSCACNNLPVPQGVGKRRQKCSREVRRDFGPPQHDMWYFY